MTNENRFDFESENGPIDEAHVYNISIYADENYGLDWGISFYNTSRVCVLSPEIVPISVQDEDNQGSHIFLVPEPVDISSQKNPLYNKASRDIHKRNYYLPALGRAYLAEKYGCIFSLNRYNPGLDIDEVQEQIPAMSALELVRDIWAADVNISLPYNVSKEYLNYLRSWKNILKVYNQYNDDNNLSPADYTYLLVNRILIDRYKGIIYGKDKNNYSKTVDGIDEIILPFYTITKNWDYAGVISLLSQVPRLRNDFASVNVGIFQSVASDLFTVLRSPYDPRFRANHRYELIGDPLIKASGFDYYINLVPRVK